MKTQNHFEELLRLLEENHVEYVIVGGYAVAFHGFPRFTKDIDIFYQNSPDNISRIRRALKSFGFSEVDIPAELFFEPGNIIQFGVSPLRVDIINEIDGVDFFEARSGAVRGTFGSINVNFLGLSQLIKNKRATGRAQDALDADRLERAGDEV
ncbi:MAG: nucleotidyltransferase [Chitinispirillaceae bacterium]|nr:nucleotidyltransferase [Chitinispirillaceae bacterium]